MFRSNNQKFYLNTALLITGILCIIASIMAIVDARRALDALQTFRWITPNAIVAEIRRDINIIIVYSGFSTVMGILIMLCSNLIKFAMLKYIGMLKCVVALTMAALYIVSGEIINFRELFFMSALPFICLIFGAGCFVLGYKNKLKYSRFG